MRVSASGKIWVAKKDVHQRHSGIPIFDSKNLDDLRDLVSFISPCSSEKLSIGNLDESVDFIRSLPKRSNIIVHGDYDADGITSTAMMVKLLRKLGHDPKYILPSRFSAGYGLDFEKITELISPDEENFLISLDTGTGEGIKIRDLKEVFGVKTLVIDHHEAGESVADCLVVNPKIFGSKEAQIFTTATLVYKIIEKIFSDVPDEFKSLAALGTSADIAPIVLENWSIIKSGLEVFPGGNLGLAQIAQIAEISPPFTNRDLGFVFAPRLNASGRLSNPMISLEVLISEDLEEVRKLALKLNEENLERQKLTSDSVEIVQENIRNLDGNVAIFGDENFSRGIVGLIASRVVDARGGAAFIYEKNDENYIGSARSDGSVNLAEVLQLSRSVLTSGGGHKMAAGFTFHPSREEEFKKTISKFAEQNFKKVAKTESALFQTSDLSQEFLSQVFEIIESLRPFGAGNPKPSFLIKDALVMYSDLIGKDKNHQKMTLTVGGRISVKAVQFKFTKRIFPSERYDFLVNVSKNEFQGRVSYELMVKDFRNATES